jgi:hypothetical protein
LSPEQSGKVEYERERLLGIANKSIHLFAIPSSLSCFRNIWRYKSTMKIVPSNVSSIGKKGSGAGGALSTAHDVIISIYFNL